MTTRIEDEQIEVIDDGEIDKAVDSTLADAAVDMDTLRSFAERGRFDTEKQRRAWFLIRGLGRA